MPFAEEKEVVVDSDEAASQSLMSWNQVNLPLVLVRLRSPADAESCGASEGDGDVSA